MISLHVCTKCGGQLVYPLGWSETDDGRWDITLRCPDCEECPRGRFEHEDVEVFDQVLNEGTDKLIDSLELLQKRNMQDYAVLFLKALQADALLPEDF